MSLAKLLVTLKGGIFAKVIGDKNINIQGISNSTIVINDLSKIEKTLSEVIQSTQQQLYFIIFSDGTETPHEWKPFKKRNILKLIQTCMSNFTNVNSVLWFIDPSLPIDNSIEDDLKTIKGQSIILFNTSYEYCQLFKEIFNNYDIGGCIAIPDCDSINLQTLLNVRTDEKRMNLHNKTYKYAIKNIKSDFDIMEAINNIISVYMDGFKFSRAVIEPNDEKQKSPISLSDL